MKEWTKKEEEALKELYPYFSNSDLGIIFNTTKKSIDMKGKRLELKKLDCVNDGMCYCRKCGRNLPYTEQYFPKIKKEKNLRKICRECNPKYYGFLKDKQSIKNEPILKPMRGFTLEEIKLLNEIYPYYTNEEIVENFMPNADMVKMKSVGSILKLKKTEETIKRGKRQAGIKHRERLQRLVREGKYVSPVKGRKMSEEQRQAISKRQKEKGAWVGDKNPRHKNPLYGKDNGRYQGGLTPLNFSMRENITEWKQNSMEYWNYCCFVTGLNFKQIHHIVPFNQILKESLDELGLIRKEKVSDYTKEEFNKLKELIQKKHELYGLGVCMMKEVHDLFHNEYSYSGSTFENLLEFVENYFNGKYDEMLEDKFRSYNSKTSKEICLELLIKLKNKLY